MKPAGLALFTAVVAMMTGLVLLAALSHNGFGCASAAAQPTASRDAQNTIPGNYLDLYKKTGAAYGIDWTVLAGIGQVETHHGRLQAAGVTSGANPWGASGPMQIGTGGAAGNTWGGAPRHPATQHAGIGVDGNHDGWDDVYDPADAIPGAARYLKAHGATKPHGLHNAIWAYNHSEAYINQVLGYAKRYGDGGFTLAGTNTPATCGPALGPGATPNAIAAQVIKYAKAQLGKPYIYGGTGPRGYDCSGLTSMAYRSAGVTIPRLSDAQYWFGPKVPKGQEQPGDLVYFEFLPGHSGPGHVGIVYNPSKGLMLVAPHTGDVIKIQNYKTYPGGPAGFTRPYDKAAKKTRTSATGSPA